MQWELERNITVCEHFEIHVMIILGFFKKTSMENFILSKTYAQISNIDEVLLENLDSILIILIRF